jgi:hypothetical protein
MMMIFGAIGGMKIGRGNRLSYGAAFFSPISSPLTTRRVTVDVFDPASTRVKQQFTHRYLYEGIQNTNMFIVFTGRV